MSIEAWWVIHAVMMVAIVWSGIATMDMQT